MRLFIGVDTNLDLDKYIAYLDSVFLGVRHICVKHPHMTLQFVGELDKEYVSYLIDYLHRVKCKSFDLNIDGYSYFGQKNIGSIHFKVKPNLKLITLQDSIFNQCELFKIFLADQNVKLELNYAPFVPHITLLRFKENISKLQELDLNLKKSLQITTFVLYDSILTQNGSIYKEVYRFNLK